MPHYTTSDIRNIAFVGQSGSGKTTLTEALLQHAGVIDTMGKVENGSTVCDFDALEKTYQHSLSTAIVSFNQEDKHINLLDTPGYPDLIGHALSVFPAVETVAVVINAQAGIELLTQQMLSQATQQQLSRLIIINKIDAPDSDLPHLIDQIQTIVGQTCLPINLPTANGTQVIDCFSKTEGTTDFGSVAEAHTQLLDQIVEMDEALMMAYLEGETIEFSKLQTAFEYALKTGHLTPICFVSAQTGAGIPALAHVLAHIPSPVESQPHHFLKGVTETLTLPPDPQQHVVAHVFKITADPFMGKVSLFRIHQGTIHKDTPLFIGEARKPFKVGHLFKLQGKQQIEVVDGIPGDICAVAKVEALHLDAILHDTHDEDSIQMQPLDFPLPMYGLAIMPKRQGDEQRISTTLQKLEGEDPCLIVEHQAALNQTVLRGLGEFHLRVVLEKMQKYYNVEGDTQPPKIPYRETINAMAEGHHRHKKQTGGAGQFGEVFLRIEPLERGTGFEFVNAIVGGVIPAQFIPAVEKGVQQVLEKGAIAGYPLQDIKVTVYDGKHHPVDSKEIAFISAGKKAFLDAIVKAKPLVLEPIVAIDVTLPEADMGTVAGDLASKRGRIQGNETRPGGKVVIKAFAPLSELSHYTTELKSATGGYGFFSMRFSHYDPVPSNIQQQMMVDYKPVEGDD